MLIACRVPADAQVRMLPRVRLQGVLNADRTVTIPGCIFMSPQKRSPRQHSNLRIRRYPACDAPLHYQGTGNLAVHFGQRAIPPEADPGKGNRGRIRACASASVEVRKWSIACLQAMRKGGFAR